MFSCEATLPPGVCKGELHMCLLTCPIPLAFRFSFCLCSCCLLSLSLSVSFSLYSYLLLSLSFFSPCLFNANFLSASSLIPLTTLECCSLWFLMRFTAMVSAQTLTVVTPMVKNSTICPKSQWQQNIVDTFRYSPTKKKKNQRCRITDIT